MDLIAMPQLGETVTEGTITTWSKQVGDEVALDDALFEVSTEKVDTEVPSAVTGYLRAILVAEGDTVPIGTAVAVITATADEDLDLEALGGEDGPPAVPAAGQGRTPTEAASDEHPDENGRGSASSRPPAPAGRNRPAPERHRHDGGDEPVGGPRSASGVLSPAVRRLLDEHGLHPDDVGGSGRDGRITRADVLAAAAQADRHPDPSVGASPAVGASAPAAPVPPLHIGDHDEVVDFSRARLATAEHMVRSLATSAHALVAVEVDYAAVDPVRRAAGLSYLPFVARAVIDAIDEFPHVNASVDGDRLVVHNDVNLGVAVDVEQEALMVPVVHGADGLRLVAPSAAVVDLADQARRRRLGGDAFTGGTFTLTNVGSYGTLVTAPIINQPQVAILSTDGVRMAPVAVRIDDGASAGDKQWGLAVHPVGNLCLSFDHRAFDGAYAAAFLARVREILQTRDWATEVAP
ncbi:MAG: 2-oxo acid dehydrogenase subunit E2 [Acidimicrobiia bacterium]|nr:2-oxo acid dehydrogenase subunit E2 [Acidimicrobiia bacterium]